LSFIWKKSFKGISTSLLFFRLSYIRQYLLMESNKERLSQLLQIYLQNKLTAAEYQEMWALLNDNPDEIHLKDELQMLWQQAKTEPALIPADEWDYSMQLLKNKLKEETISKPAIPKRVVRLHKYWWAAAAVLIVFMSSALYFLVNNNRNNQNANEITTKTSNLKDDVMPGGDKAMLTLSDGSTIVLDSAGNGILAQQGNTQIIKQQNGELIYNASGEGNNFAFNILSTPHGGQYKLTLPDGSKVWLNAASSLKYPTAFSGNSRQVEVTGEAYFEITKDVNRPFKVQVNQMEVEVLGTHFNVNGYEDEHIIHTTLLEGRVKINTQEGSNFLNPGQQAQLQKSGKIKLINDADLEEIMAWKNGNFQFENADISVVMRQLARWYDVDVEYKGNVSRHFIGTISRSVNLSQVLTMLEQTGEVKFKIEGRKVIVMP